MVFSPNLLQYSDSDKIQQTHFPGLQLKTVIVMGWVENEDLRPQNEDPLKVTYKYLETGISTLDE